MAFQLFGGTDTQVQSYTGPERELVVNMTNNTLHLQDGSTAGGWVFKTADALKQELLDGASAAYDTLKEIEDYISANQGSMGSLLTDLSTKAPKPAAPSQNGEVLTWDGSNFANTVLGMTRTDDGTTTTFTFS